MLCCFYCMCEVNNINNTIKKKYACLHMSTIVLIALAETRCVREFAPRTTQSRRHIVEQFHCTTITTKPNVCVLYMYMCLEPRSSHHRSPHYHHRQYFHNSLFDWTLINVFGARSRAAQLCIVASSSSHRLLICLAVHARSSRRNFFCVVASSRALSTTI